MTIYDTIKSWFDGPDKNKLDHFNLDKIEKITSKIKVEPFLTFMQPQIEVLLRNISISSKENKGIERKFIVINGVSGSGKTNLVYEYLQDFLLASGVTKKSKDLIDKIASHDLNNFRLHGRKVEDVIDEKVSGCKDGILIIDEFSSSDKNAPLISSLINKIYSDKDFLYTAVILMGEYRSNSAFLNSYDLDGSFPEKFRLNFYTPSFNQITDIFEVYAKREGDYILTEKAKSSLIYYFSKTKSIKEIKANLNRQGKLKFPFKERKFIYTSEMFPIYKDIVVVKNNNNKVIEQNEILNTITYKKMLEDIQNLEK